MNSRRTHRKSRFGCVPCKRRRVKCDEARPRCSNCRQRQEQCQYGTEASYIWNPTGNHPSEESVTGDSSIDASPRLSLEEDPTSRLLNWLGPDESPPTSSTVLNMDHLELVTQWVQETHTCAAHDEAARKIWQILVLREAVLTPFLMHGILALSALHLSLLRANNKKTSWLSMAIAHKNEALKSFTQQLSNVNASNAKALFSFASLVVAFAFGSSLTGSAVYDQPGLDGLINVLLLSRDVQNLSETTSKFILQSNFAPLLNMPLPTTAIPDRVTKEFDHLLELNNFCGRKSHHDVALYEKVIKNLQEMSPCTYAQPTSLTLAAGFAIRSPEFLEFLRQREPLALVVVAAYCVFLHMARENWCIGPWARLILKDIQLFLPVDWQPYIRWAVTEVFGTSDLPSLA